MKRRRVADNLSDVTRFRTFFFLALAGFGLSVFDAPKTDRRAFATGSRVESARLTEERSTLRPENPVEIMRPGPRRADPHPFVGPLPVVALATPPRFAIVSVRAAVRGDGGDFLREPKAREPPSSTVSRPI